MVVLGTTIHEFACSSSAWPMETRGWSRPSPTMTIENKGEIEHPYPTLNLSIASKSGSKPKPGASGIWIMPFFGNGMSLPTSPSLSM